jgi:putative endonuclease
MKVGDRSWFLYVVHCSDDTLYTGVTTDISRRIREHNTGSRGAKYTKTRRPVRLVYWVDFKDRSTAQRAEYKFKKLTRKQKNEVINEHYTTS